MKIKTEFDWRKILEFNDFVAFVEEFWGIKLTYAQKIVLGQIWKGNQVFYISKKIKI